MRDRVTRRERFAMKTSESRWRAWESVSSFLCAAVVTISCLLLVLLAPTAAPADRVAPSNDTFLDSLALNPPGNPLNATETLSSNVDITAATVQPDMFTPCGGFICSPGPPEQTTCHGVPYGHT